jgi:Flp pilus assembly protein TadG
MHEMTHSPKGERLIGRLHALAADRRGGPAMEFALAAPAMLLFVFGIIELGYALWMQNALDYSAATAARCASINANACHPISGSSQVTAYAANASGTSLTSSAFTYTGTASCGCQVTGSYTIALDIPWDNALSVTLSSEACVAPPPQKNCAS